MQVYSNTLQSAGSMPDPCVPFDQATMTESPFLTLHELVKKARQKLNHDNWDYLGAADEIIPVVVIQFLSSFLHQLVQRQKWGFGHRRLVKRHAWIRHGSCTLQGIRI